MNHPQKSFLKSVALTLLFCLIFQEFSYGLTEVLKPQDAHEADLAWARCKLAGVPESVATVEDAWQGSEKLVILVQDAHTNPSAQINESKLLDHLLKKTGATGTIFLEAGEGDESLSFLRPHAGLEKRTQAAKSFLMQGRLQGVEYLDLTSDHKLLLYGVEDMALYSKAVGLYRQVRQKRGRFEDYLSKIQSTVDTLRPQVLNPFLLDFDDERQKFLKDKISFNVYLNSLFIRAGQLGHRFKHLKRLKELKDKEAKIDFAKANAEQGHLVLSLPEAERQELSGAAKCGDRKVRDAFYSVLAEKIKDPSVYPHLSKYLHYLKEARTLDPGAVLEEQKALEEEIIESLIVSEEEKVFLETARLAGLFQKMASLQMTPEEYAEYGTKGGSEPFKKVTGFLNKLLLKRKTAYDKALFLEEGYEDMAGLCTEFYELTLERDRKFIENMLPKLNPKAPNILITGGYHAPNLKSLLKKENISYISVTPQILEETNTKRYEEILLKQKSPAVAFSASAAMTMPERLIRNGDMPEFVSRIGLDPALASARLARSSVISSPKDEKSPLETGISHRSALRNDKEKSAGTGSIAARLAVPQLGPTRPDLESEFMRQVEASSPDHVKRPLLFDIRNNKGRIKVTLLPRHLQKYDAETNPEGLGLLGWLEDYEREAQVATAGIRSSQNVRYPWDTRFRVNEVGVALATLGKALAAKESYFGAALQKMTAGEVRYNTPEYVELVARIQAAQGIRTYLPSFRKTLTIWMTSFLTFMLDLAGAEFGTSSHANSSFFATKDIDNEGSQYLPEESLRFVGKIREIFNIVQTAGKYEFEIAAADDPLIDESLMKRLQDGVKLYAQYLKNGVATEVNLQRIRGVRSKILVDNVGGALYRTTEPILNDLGIEGSFEWLRTKEDPFFYGIGKQLTAEGKFIDHSQDATIIKRDKNTGEVVSIPVMERMDYDALLKDKPVGTTILIGDPDGDRLVTAQIEPRARAGFLEKVGVDYLRLDDNRALALYSPNQSFFMTMAYQAESLREAGLWDDHPRFIIMTTASSAAWREWAEKNGVKVLNVPVGFKEIAAMERKVESQLQKAPHEPVIVTDVFGNKVNLGVQPRLLFAGEESGGALMGPEELIKSFNGRAAIAMREKSDGEMLVIQSAMVAHLETRNKMLSDYLLDLFESNGIQGRFDVREDVVYYNQSEPDPDKLAHEKIEGEKKRTKNYMFYLSLALAFKDRRTTLQEVRVLLHELFAKEGLDFLNLSNISFVGDGVFFEFPDKVLEIRPSGTDAKSKAYAMGKDKRLLARYAAAVGNYSGDLTRLHQLYVPENYTDETKLMKMQWKVYQAYYRNGLPEKTYQPPAVLAETYAFAGARLAQTDKSAARLAKKPDDRFSYTVEPKEFQIARIKELLSLVLQSKDMQKDFTVPMLVRLVLQNVRPRSRKYPELARLVRHNEGLEYRLYSSIYGIVSLAEKLNYVKRRSSQDLKTVHFQLTAARLAADNQRIPVDAEDLLQKIVAEGRLIYVLEKHLSRARVDDQFNYVNMDLESWKKAYLHDEKYFDEDSLSRKAVETILKLAEQYRIELKPRHFLFSSSPPTRANEENTAMVHLRDLWARAVSTETKRVERPSFALVMNFIFPAYQRTFDGKPVYVDWSKPPAGFKFSVRNLKDAIHEAIPKLGQSDPIRTIRGRGETRVIASTARGPRTRFGDGARLAESRKEVRGKGVEEKERPANLGDQAPTLASSLLTRFSRLGTAILTASLRVLTSVSTAVRRSLTSAISSLKGSTTSRTDLKSLLRSSISAPTWEEVKPLSSLSSLMKRSVSDAFWAVNSAVRHTASADSSSTRSRGARLAVNDPRGVLGMPDRDRWDGPKIMVGGSQVFQGEGVHGRQVKGIVGEKMMPETKFLSFTELRGGDLDDSAEQGVVVDQDFGLTLGQTESPAGTAHRVFGIDDKSDFGMLGQTQPFDGLEHSAFIGGLQDLSHLYDFSFSTEKYTTNRQPGLLRTRTAARLAADKVFTDWLRQKLLPEIIGNLTHDQLDFVHKIYVSRKRISDNNRKTLLMTAAGLVLVALNAAPGFYIIALGTVAIFAGSTVLHELGHLFVGKVAQMKGYLKDAKISFSGYRPRVTLFMSHDFTFPTAWFIGLLAAGPLVNLVLGLSALPFYIFGDFKDFESRTLLQAHFVTNFGLFVFNAFWPSPPLSDGNKIRALLDNKDVLKAAQENYESLKDVKTPPFSGIGVSFFVRRNDKVYWIGAKESVDAMEKPRSGKNWPIRYLARVYGEVPVPFTVHGRKLLTQDGQETFSALGEEFVLFEIVDFHPEWLKPEAPTAARLSTESEADDDANPRREAFDAILAILKASRYRDNAEEALGLLQRLEVLKSRYFPNQWPILFELISIVGTAVGMETAAKLLQTYSGANAEKPKSRKVHYSILVNEVGYVPRSIKQWIKDGGAISPEAVVIRGEASKQVAFQIVGDDGEVRDVIFSLLGHEALIIAPNVVDPNSRDLAVYAVPKDFEVPWPSQDAEVAVFDRSPALDRQNYFLTLPLVYGGELQNTVVVHGTILSNSNPEASRRSGGGIDVDDEFTSDSFDRGNIFGLAVTIIQYLLSDDRPAFHHRSWVATDPLLAQGPGNFVVPLITDKVGGQIRLTLATTIKANEADKNARAALHDQMIAYRSAQLNLPENDQKGPAVQIVAYENGLSRKFAPAYGYDKGVDYEFVHIGSLLERLERQRASLIASGIISEEDLDHVLRRVKALNRIDPLDFDKVQTELKEIMEKLGILSKAPDKETKKRDPFRIRNFEQFGSRNIFTKQEILDMVKTPPNRNNRSRHSRVMDMFEDSLQRLEVFADKPSYTLEQLRRMQDMLEAIEKVTEPWRKLVEEGRFDELEGYDPTWVSQIDGSDNTFNWYDFFVDSFNRLRDKLNSIVVPSVMGREGEKLKTYVRIVHSDRRPSRPKASVTPAVESESPIEAPPTIEVAPPIVEAPVETIESPPFGKPQELKEPSLVEQTRPDEPPQITVEAPKVTATPPATVETPSIPKQPLVTPAPPLVKKTPSRSVTFSSQRNPEKNNRQRGVREAIADFKITPPIDGLSAVLEIARKINPNRSENSFNKEAVQTLAEALKDTGMTLQFIERVLTADEEVLDRLALQSEQAAILVEGASGDAFLDYLKQGGARLALEADLLLQARAIQTLGLARKQAAGFALALADNEALHDEYLREKLDTFFNENLSHGAYMALKPVLDVIFSNPSAFSDGDVTRIVYGLFALFKEHALVELGNVGAVFKEAFVTGTPAEVILELPDGDLAAYFIETLPSQLEQGLGTAKSVHFSLKIKSTRRKEVDDLGFKGIALHEIPEDPKHLLLTFTGPEVESEIGLTPAVRMRIAFNSTVARYKAKTPKYQRRVEAKRQEEEAAEKAKETRRNEGQAKQALGRAKAVAKRALRKEMTEILHAQRIRAQEAYAFAKRAETELQDTVKFKGLDEVFSGLNQALDAFGALDANSLDQADSLRTLRQKQDGIKEGLTKSLAATVSVAFARVQVTGEVPARQAYALYFNTEGGEEFKDLLSVPDMATLMDNYFNSGAPSAEKSAAYRVLVDRIAAVIEKAETESLDDTQLTSLYTSFLYALVWSFYDHTNYQLGRDDLVSGFFKVMRNNRGYFAAAGEPINFREYVFWMVLNKIMIRIPETAQNKQTLSVFRQAFLTISARTGAYSSNIADEVTTDERKKAKSSLKDSLKRTFEPTSLSSNDIAERFVDRINDLPAPGDVLKFAVLNQNTGAIALGGAAYFYLRSKVDFSVIQALPKHKFERLLLIQGIVLPNHTRAINLYRVYKDVDAGPNWLSGLDTFVQVDHMHELASELQSRPPTDVLPEIVVPREFGFVHRHIWLQPTAMTALALMEYKSVMHFSNFTEMQGFSGRMRDFSETFKKLPETTLTERDRIDFNRANAALLVPGLITALQGLEYFYGIDDAKDVPERILAHFVSDEILAIMNREGTLQRYPDLLISLDKIDTEGPEIVKRVIAHIQSGGEDVARYSLNSHEIWAKAYAKFKEATAAANDYFGINVPVEKERLQKRLDLFDEVAHEAASAGVALDPSKIDAARQEVGALSQSTWGAKAKIGSLDAAVDEMIANTREGALSQGSPVDKAYSDALNAFKDDGDKFSEANLTRMAREFVDFDPTWTPDQWGKAIGQVVLGSLWRRPLSIPLNTDAEMDYATKVGQISALLEREQFISIRVFGDPRSLAKAPIKVAAIAIVFRYLIAQELLRRQRALGRSDTEQIVAPINQKLAERKVETAQSYGGAAATVTTSLKERMVLIANPEGNLKEIAERVLDETVSANKLRYSDVQFAIPGWIRFLTAVQEHPNLRGDRSLQDRISSLMSRLEEVQSTNPENIGIEIVRELVYIRIDVNKLAPDSSNFNPIDFPLPAVGRVTIEGDSETYYKIGSYDLDSDGFESGFVSTAQSNTLFKIRHSEFPNRIWILFKIDPSTSSLGFYAVQPEGLSVYASAENLDKLKKAVSAAGEGTVPTEVKVDSRPITEAPPKALASMSKDLRKEILESTRADRKMTKDEITAEFDSIEIKISLLLEEYKTDTEAIFIIQSIKTNIDGIRKIFELRLGNQEAFSDVASRTGLARNVARIGSQINRKRAHFYLSSDGDQFFRKNYDGIGHAVNRIANAINNFPVQGNAARLAETQTSTPGVYIGEEEVVDFLMAVFAAQGRQGRIVVDLTEYELKPSEKKLIISRFGREIFRTTEWHKVVSGSREDTESGEYQIPMGDLRVILSHAFEAAGEIHMSAVQDQKKALSVINLAGFDRKMKGMKELVIPYLVKELGYAARNEYGKNARFLIEGSDEIKAMVLAELEETGKLKELVFTDRDEVPAGYEEFQAAVTDAANPVTRLRNLYTQVPQEGDIPNFRALIKLSLKLARIEKLDASDEDFRQFLNDLKVLLGWTEDVDIVNFRDAIQAATRDINKRYIFGMITRVPINAALAAARLATAMAGQSA